MKKKLLLISLLFIGVTLSSCDLKLSPKDNVEDNNNTTNTEDTDIITKCNHNFVDNTCSVCNTEKNEYVLSLFGEDTIIYSNNMTNPYNVNLNDYGKDVYAVFYDPVFKNDPYKDVVKTTFYASYEKAKSYEDSYYRTNHGLMSGDITPQTHLPKDSSLKEADKYIRLTTATYVLDTNGNYIAYVINDLNSNNDIIYYGGAYTSLNEVAAYLLAFGEVPANSSYDKNSGQSISILKWGEYGRCNVDHFSGNTNSFPYEPYLPKVNSIYYTETDFGTIGGYVNESISKTYKQKNYNDGNEINRGAARLCFVSDSSIKSIDKRYVFYTYNHYNDFQEYLNYNDGFGQRFGNESAGNQYCSSRNDYYESAKAEPTLYPETLNKSIKSLN